MRILALEPYNGGSHKAFLDSWSKVSRHNWAIIGLPPNKWKWRMRHGAITLADEVNNLVKRGERYDLVFCSDMLNLAEFRGLVSAEISKIPIVVYFHENQLTYPVQVEKERDIHFALTNMSTALAADRVWFNSMFHLESFLTALPALLKRMPDFQMLDKIDLIRDKSSVQPQGINPIGFPSCRKNGSPKILWAARWEHDKNPELFFEAIQKLQKKNIDFRVSVVGEQFENAPEIFDKMKPIFTDRIDHWGYQKTQEDYNRVLQESDIVVSTADHEFFGVTIVEAISAGAFPLLPNKLVYPELLPPELVNSHDDFFYDGGAKKLESKLTELIARTVSRDLWGEDIKRAEKGVSRFYWETLAPHLDNELEKLSI